MIKTLKIQNMQIDYATFFNGSKTFVIIPGLSLRSVMLSADMVENRYKIFKDDYTVYLIDRRKNAPESYSIEEMAEDTALAMRAIGISNACVFGASQGGMIAQCIAENHPDLVGKLVLGSTLCETNPNIEAVIGKWIALAKAGKTDKLIPDMLDNIYSAKTLEKYRDFLIASYGKITNDELKQFIIMASAAVDGKMSDRLSQIKCPVYVIGSMGDKVTTPQGAQKIAAALGCGLYMYDEASAHGVYDEADDYPLRILNFLNDN